MEGHRLQSAMEYLMTYGWAILVIAVVLGALYQLGIFGTSTSFFGSSCLATTGFLCQTPVINTSGYLAVKFGEIGMSSFTITGIACTTNTTAPTSVQGVNLQLASGATAAIAFSCPLQSNALGTGFKGYLWLTYSTPAQSGILDRIAVVTGKVSTTGGAIAALGGTGPSAGGLFTFSHYVPITLTNSQSGATGANFQQMIVVNSNTYSAYINSAWSNVEFTTGAGATGTVIQAWVESGNSNTATSTVIWLKLPNSILANSNTVVYMNFMNSNILSSSGPTGLAPQSSSSYGQYDNGGSVFNAYDSFSGTSLSSFWNRQLGSGAYSVSNGLSVTGNYRTIQTTSTYAYPQIGETLVTSLQGSGDIEIGAGTGTLAPGSGCTNQFDQGYRAVYSTSSPYTILQVDGIYCSTLGSSTTVYGTPLILGVAWIGNSNEAGLVNENALFSGSDSHFSIANYYFWISAEGAPVTNMAFQWFRTRAYPPSGIIPSVSFGTLV